MDHFIQLTNELVLLNQQLRMRQLANEHQRRVTTQVRSQVWQPYASMDYAQYGGTLYFSNHNFGWNQHPNTSWNTSYTTLQIPQVQRSSLEETMAKLERVYAEQATSQVLHMMEVNTPPQEESIVEQGVDGLSLTRPKLTLSRVELIMDEIKFNAQIQPISLKCLEEEMTPMVTSCIESIIESNQPLQEKGMSIQELVAKHMNENENRDEMSFKRQQESLPSTLEVNKEEENLSYNEEIISRDNEELEKFQRVEKDAQTSKDLVAMEEEESTSLEMTLWMHKELKNECII